MCVRSRTFRRQRELEGALPDITRFGEDQPTAAWARCERDGAERHQSLGSWSFAAGSGRWVFCRSRGPSGVGWFAAAARGPGDDEAADDARQQDAPRMTAATIDPSVAGRAVLTAQAFDRTS